MDFRVMLEMNREYSAKWILGGFGLTLGISLALRTIPLTLGSDLVFLYYLPFWLCIEMILISLFAVYGWLALVVSIATDAYLRALLGIGFLAWPSVLWFSDILLLTLVAGYLRMLQRNPSSVDQEEWLYIHSIILLIVYGITMFAVSRIFAVSMTLDGWIQILGGLPGSFLMTYYAGTVCSVMFLERWGDVIEPVNTERRLQTPQRYTRPDRTRQPTTVIPQRELLMGRPSRESEDLVYMCPHCNQLTTPGRCDHCGQRVS